LAGVIARPEMGRSSYLDPAAVRFVFPDGGFLLPSALARARGMKQTAQKIAPSQKAAPSPARGFFRFLWAVFGQEGFFLLEIFHITNRRQSLWNKGETRMKFVFFGNPLSGFEIPFTTSVNE